jgi:hypothetical protein
MTSRRWTGRAAPFTARPARTRLPAPLLDAFVADPDLLVRWQAASRAIGHALARFAADAEPEIRERAQARLAELQRRISPDHEARQDHG